MTELNIPALICSILELFNFFFHTSPPLRNYVSSYPFYENFPEFAEKRGRICYQF